MAGHHRTGAIPNQVDVLSARMAVTGELHPAPETVSRCQQGAVGAGDGEIVQPGRHRSDVLAPVFHLR